MDPNQQITRSGAEERDARICQLQGMLVVCPTDIGSRCELALLLEESNRPKDALDHWKAVLTFDPNSLQAREGIARCRPKAGMP